MEAAYVPRGGGGVVRGETEDRMDEEGDEEGGKSVKIRERMTLKNARRKRSW